jgi:hypothetical protein
MRSTRVRVPFALALGMLVWACQEEGSTPLGPEVPEAQFSGALVLADGTGPLSGAIFTTTEDGSVVNENVHYQKKEDVYLDGGPGPNAPSKAAGLPAGDYYFQVTDPSGKDLLSTDHISCRKIRVNDDGVIDYVYGGTNYVYSNKDKVWEAEDCQHKQGVDVDHDELGAITVQLYPYDDTPNPGGVYKAWVTPVDKYTGDPDYEPSGKHDDVNGENYQPGDYHGFVPRWSKTDNYKVKQKGPPFDPPIIQVRKFHDKNLNGDQDAGEEDVTGWSVDVSDPLGVTNEIFTPETVVAAAAGDYTFVEDTPTGTLQTVSIRDGVDVSAYPTADPTVVVSVAGTSGETHTVVYGNVGLGEVKACKVFDRNGNGSADDGEPGIPGWKVQLTGTDVTGGSVDVTQTTGEDGCTTFTGLLPGSYTATELIPSTGNWKSTGETSYDFDIVSTLSGATISGGSHDVTFLNCCKQYADFGTKGYWHNKNGLQELEEAFIVGVVNTLAPYSSASSYFGDGDEPFDGEFGNGDPVDGAFNDDGSPIWGPGTWQSEVSLFLVDDNAGGDPREQLAQQLLAFIFNVEYRLGGGDAAIWDGTTWVIAGDLVAAAIDVWENGTGAEQTAMQERLAGFNESDAVPFIPSEPCEVIYP